jgi:hypothetical protein
MIKKDPPQCDASAGIYSQVAAPVFQLQQLVDQWLGCAYRGRRPRCPAHGDHVIRSMTTGAAHELDGAVGFIF